MRFVVTGAQGQVGIALTKRLSELGIDHASLSRQELDISSEPQIHRLLADYRPDAVINCAAYNAVDKAEVDSATAFSVNRDGPARLAAACAEIGSVLVHFSTDYVFDGKASRPYIESDPTCPLNTYGLSKLAGEQAVLGSDASHIVLRVSWVFGRIGKSFIDDVLKWASTGALRIVDDQRSVPCDAVTLAAATIEATQKLINDPGLSGLYHFAMGAPVSRHEYAETIVEQASKLGIMNAIPVEAVSSAMFKTAATRPANSGLDSSRFESQFGIQSGDWRDGLRAYLECLTDSPYGHSR